MTLSVKVLQVECVSFDLPEVGRSESRFADLEFEHENRGSIDQNNVRSLTHARDDVLEEKVTGFELNELLLEELYLRLPRERLFNAEFLDVMFSDFAEDRSRVAPQ